MLSRRNLSREKSLKAREQDEGRRQLGKRLAQRGRNKWWAFEGFSRIDCCLITRQCVLFVGGKRTESVSPSVRETAGPFAAGQVLHARFAVFLTFRDGQIVKQHNYDCFDDW